MTRQEVYKALADGKAKRIQRMSRGCVPMWLDSGSEDNVIGWLASDSGSFEPERYRLKPEPKVRTIKAEELPAVFWVRSGTKPAAKLCTAILHQDLRLCGTWFAISRLRESGEYSTDRLTWHRFEKE